MAKYGAFKYGDAKYGTGASFHAFHSSQGGRTIAHVNPGGKFTSSQGGRSNGFTSSYLIQKRTVASSQGGRFAFAQEQNLAVPDAATYWTGSGDLSTTTSQSWRYTATGAGTLAVDTVGTDWNTVITVYASNRSTVLATASGSTGVEAATSLSVTAGQTVYVQVAQGTGATSTDGRYLINATGPASTDAVPNQSQADPAPAIPSASSPPSGMTVVPIKRVSITLGSPSLDSAGRPVQPWTPTISESDWGNFRVVVAGVDVTYFRGFPVQVETYDLQEPFGPGKATITFPGITPHDAVGTGDTNWLIGGYYVDILNGSTSLWTGAIANQVGQYDASGAGYTIECVGDVWLADLVGHQPRTYLPPVDIGSMVPVVLNLVPHRRAWGIAQVTTGIKTTQRGSADTSVLGYAQELLANSTTDDGSNQWTIARVPGSARHYEMRLKNRASISWSLQTGQPGAEIRLNLDSSTAVNRIFGRGIRTDGYAWAGWVYPVVQGAALSYPNSSPSATLTVGSTDAGTTSGSGVSDWQRRINETGLASVTVDGTYSAADATAAKTVQAKKGLTVDGIVGPQTWAASFDVGAAGAGLDGAYRAPLAALAGVTPNLTQADGSFGGANPADNKNLLVVDRDEDFGDGVSKAEATRSATAELARTNNPGWVGEIVLKADPPELSRFDIVEGSNGTIKGWAGRDVTVHVAQVKVSPPRDTDQGTVTLTVDEHARDLMTLGSILRRDRDAARNPAMLPPRKQRRSQLRADSVVEYDGESSGGIVPRFALFGGLWSVIRIPVSQAGKVAKVNLTTSPATPFCVAFFGDVVTPADLKTLVGANPLADRGDGFGPFDWNYDALVTRGFIEAIGGPGQACGYDPGYQTSPHTNTSTPLTGKLISTGSWTYRSVRPPWLWVALYAVSSTFISGRIFPAPVDT